MENTSSSWFQTAKQKEDQLLTYISQHKRQAALVGLGVTSAALYFMLRPKIRKNTILELDLSQIVLTDAPISTSFMDLLNSGGHRRIWYRDLVEALELAAKEPNVKGLICNFGHCTSIAEMGLAHLEELREALMLFRKNGKLSLCWAEMFGPPNAMKAYYLASSFDKICVTRTSVVYIPGLLATATFFKEMLDKLGVEATIYQRENYKSMANAFTQTKFDEYHREQVQRITDQLSKQFIADIANGRNKSEEKVDTWLSQVNDWLSQGVFTAKKAKESGVVDMIAFRDEAYEELAKMCKLNSRKEANWLFVTKYLEKVGRPYQRGKTRIAIVYLSGAISDGENMHPGATDGIFSINAARAIRAAREDSRTRAIILRIDSPGGTASAADYILREIQLAKEAGKKIVVSMGNVAASGGYWISALADKIVCNSFTITGSIGVIMGKLNFKETIGKLGITFDQLMTHDKARMFSGVNGLTPDEQQLLIQLLDEFYQTFMDIVGKGRNISNVRELAQGKVYLGKEAEQLRLVDSIGGLTTAIETAKQLLNLKESDTIQLFRYPKVPNVFTMLRKPNNSDEMDKMRAQESLLQLPSGSGSMIADCYATTMQWLMFRFPFVRSMVNEVTTQPLIPLVRHAQSQQGMFLLAQSLHGWKF